MPRRTRHAVRFQPPGRGHTVPLVLYAEAMLKVAEAMHSVRHVAARRVAAALNLPRGEAGRQIVLSVGATEKGSLVTPILIRPAGVPQLPIYSQLEQRFWQEAQEIILGATLGTKDALAATAADNFAQAGELARDEGYGLSLAYQETAAQVKAGRWGAMVDIVTSAEPLRQYALRKRQQTEEMHITLIGEVVEVTYKPLVFRLDSTSHGRLKVHFGSNLTRKVSELGGCHAIVEARAEVNSDGVPQEIYAQEISPLRRTRTLVKDWLESRGTHDGAIIWDEEGRDYIRNLRRRGS